MWWVVYFHYWLYLQLLSHHHMNGSHWVLEASLQWSVIMWLPGSILFFLFFNLRLCQWIWPNGSLFINFTTSQDNRQIQIGQVWLGCYCNTMVQWLGKTAPVNLTIRIFLAWTLDNITVDLWTTLSICYWTLLVCISTHILFTTHGTWHTAYTYLQICW